MPADDLDTRLREHGAAPVDDCLEVFPAMGVPSRQLRVADGVVFVRESRDGTWHDRAWRPAPPQLLLGYFVDDSPVATWLRRRGADLIRVGLLALGPR